MKLVLIRHGESEWNKLNLFTKKTVQKGRAFRHGMNGAI